jgi:hypothetical protein
MTHTNSVFQPAPHSKTAGFKLAHLVGKTAKKALEKTVLTHVLTHTLPSIFDTRELRETSVAKGISALIANETLIRFFTVFRSTKNVCQNPARNLTAMFALAYSLKPNSFTTKTAIL